MSFTPTITEKPDAAEIRGHLKAAADQLVELRRTPVDKRGDTYEDDLRSAANFITTFDSVAQVYEDAERRAAEATAAEQREAAEKRAREAGLRGPLAANADLSEQARTAGAEVVLADGYEEFRQRGGTGMLSTEVRTLLTSGTGTGESGIWRPVGTPELRPGTERRLRLFVRDLISVQQTGLSSVPYIRELNALANEGGASAVSEGSAKPETVMQFEQADAQIRKIAAWIPATTEILADAPTLRGYIDNRLAYMLMLREEQQVLSGDGTAPNISGILDQTGLQTQSAVNNDVPATVGLAISKVENVDGEADGVAMNPLTFWAAVVSRHSSTFDNGGGGNAPAAMSSITWGLPVVRTRSLAELSAIVGAWRLGATLFEREGVSIRVGDQHSDYFVYNKVAILGEERVGLAVHRPDWFVDTTLDVTA